MGRLEGTEEERRRLEREGRDLGRVEGTEKERRRPERDGGGMRKTKQA